MQMRLASRSWIVLTLALALGGLAAPRTFGGDDPAPAPAPPDIDETRGYVCWGPGLVQDLDEKGREQLGIKRKAGMYVASVLPKGPGDKADMKPGDVVLKVMGKDMTSAEQIEAKNEAAFEKWTNETFSPVTHQIKPGQEVEMVLDRGGKTITVKPIAVSVEEMRRLRDEYRDDMSAVPVPDPDGQGAPRAVSYSFEKLPEDAVRPEEVLQIHGLWEVKTDSDSDKDNHVLNQSSDLGENYSLALATAKGLSYGDASASVRLRLVGGEKSVSGGIVLRARDRKNWYAVVANGSATKLQVVLMKDLVPTVIASADIGQPALKKWHTLEVSITGDKIKGVFDGKATVEATDATIKKGGWCGLLTKGDAETDFDDWKVAPPAAK